MSSKKPIERLTRETKRFYRLPDTQRGVSDAIFLFENASLDDSRRVLTTDSTKTLMNFSLHWIAVTELEHFIEFVNKRSRLHLW